MLFWLTSLHIHHWGKVHIKAYHFHFLCRNAAIFHRSFHRLFILPYCRIPRELGEWFLQSGYPAPFLVNSQDKGETVVLYGRILEVKTKSCQLNRILDIPREEDNPTQIVIPD